MFICFLVSQKNNFLPQNYSYYIFRNEQKYIVNETFWMSSQERIIVYDTAVQNLIRDTVNCDHFY